MKIQLSLKLRAALVAAVLSFSSYTLSTAQAAGVAESKEELTNTTLTNLHKGDEIKYPNESAYILQEVEGDVVAKDINITKYIFDKETGTYTPVKYNVIFNKVLGDELIEGASATHFQWEKDSEINAWVLKPTEDAGLTDLSAYATNNNRLIHESGETIIDHSFVNINFGEDQYEGEGGAVQNSATLDSISGDFVANSVSTSNVSALEGSSVTATTADGGALYNEGSIGTVTGNFISNTISATTVYAGGYSMDSNVQGGAIKNHGRIDSITGDFISNTAYASSTDSTTLSATENISADAFAKGGAIAIESRYNSPASVGDITGDFISNSVISYISATPVLNGEGDVRASVYAEGGAIYAHNAVVTNITGDFTSNSSSSTAASYADSTDWPITYSFGGAIYSSGSTITNISGDFNSNTSSTTLSLTKNASNYSYGGAISTQYGYGNTGVIENISGNFLSNSATAHTKAHDGTANDVSFSMGAYGGAISNQSLIRNINGDFISNSTSATTSISIEKYTDAYTTGFSYGGAIYNRTIMGNISGNFISNSATTNTFRTANAYGGAIYNDGSLGLLAKDQSMHFTGNYISTDGGDTKVYEAIYNGGNMNFNAYDVHAITVNDGINGSEGNQYYPKGTIAINNGVDGEGNSIAADGKAFSTVEFNSFVTNQNVTVYAGELHLGEYAGKGVEGSADYIPKTQAALNGSEVTINKGALVSVQGQLQLDSTSTMNASAEGDAGGISRIKGLTAHSSINGGSITLADNSTLSIESIKLENLAITAGINTSLLLQNITLGLGEVIASGAASLAIESTPLSYTIDGMDVGAASISGSLTLDMSMLAGEVAGINSTLDGGGDVLFTLTGLLDATLEEGLDVIFNIAQGGVYEASYMGTSAEGAQFALTSYVVPEPSTATLSLLALAGLLARRRRRA